MWVSGWWGCLLEVWGTNKKSGSAAHRAFGDEKGGGEEERLGRKLASGPPGGPPGRPVRWPWVACGKRERRDVRESAGGVPVPEEAWQRVGRPLPQEASSMSPVPEEHRGSGLVSS